MKERIKEVVHSNTRFSYSFYGIKCSQFLPVIKNHFLILQSVLDQKFNNNYFKMPKPKYQAIDLNNRNRNFLIVKKDLEDKKRRTSSNSEDFQELFVDATRNVGVGFGAKDLKQDVKSTRKKEKASSLTDIANDYEALCQRGVQLMRKGELKTSLSLLNKSVEVFYKASEQQSSQLHFLPISIFLDVAEAEDKSSLGAVSPDCYVARCRCYLRQLFVNILFIFFNAFNCLDWVL